MAKTKLDVLDFVAVACYFAGVLAIGIYSMWRVNRGTVTGYFLAGRFMTWLPVGASLFASNIGSEHFIGLAGSGSASGIAVGAFEFNSCILLQLLGWVFLPVYIASRVCTLPEFMSKRYGGNRIRIYLAILSLLLYALTKISVNLYSGAIFIQQALQWNLYISVFLLLAATAITTVTGGLTAVMYTDTLQAIIMVTGSVILCIISFVKVGGLGQLYHKYMQAIPNSTLHSNTTCGYPREDSWTMLRDPVDSDMPWPGFLLGQTTSSIWYWCADQMIVQRALAAKSLSHAKGGVLLAGYLKLLPFFLMVLPGMISRVLFTDEVACADPDICYEVCQNHVSCSNIAYPKLVLELLPSGLRGVMLSVMLAALMSDLTSIFNSASTLFTMDIYRHLRKNHTVRELMIVGRLFVCIMTVISIIWIPVIQNMQGGELYHYLVSIMAFLVPPIAAVYLAAILWTRATEQGAFWALVIGFVISISRAALDFVYEAPDCGEPDLRPAIVARVHYMYFALILFLVSVVVVVVVSLLTKPPTPDQLIRTTYWSRHDQTQRQDENSSYTDPVEETSVDPDDVENTGKAEKTELNLLDKNQTHGTKISVSDTDTAATAEKVLVSPLRHALRWFCGIDPAADSRGVAEQVKQQRRISQLKQDPRAKIALNVNLVFLISLSVFLYVFFSMENWLARWASVQQPMVATTSTYQSINGTS